jgi:hypothetical protein
MLVPISLMKILSRLSRAANVVRLSPPSHGDKILRACPGMNQICKKGNSLPRKKSTDGYPLKSSILLQNVGLRNLGGKSLWNHPNINEGLLGLQKREYLAKRKSQGKMRKRLYLIFKP